MIVGSGMMAQAFFEYAESNDVVIFASGVSNSKNISEYQFRREKLLIEEWIEKSYNKLLIYFSSCQSTEHNTAASPYEIHKLEIEHMILTKSKSFNIFRLPQVVGMTSSPTFVRMMFNNIDNTRHFYLERLSTRNLVLIDDVVSIVKLFINQNLHRNTITNIAAKQSHSVIYIVNKIEKLMGQKANYTMLNVGKSYDIDVSKLHNVCTSLHIFDDRYLDYVLNTYYSTYYNKPYS